MRVWAKRVGWLVLGLAALVAGLVMGLYAAWVRPGLARYDGEVTAPGLHGVVTIRRDARGVPHIMAQDAHDVFFAQGFVHAQDRLWAMEMARRAAAGRLSEVIGERGLANDRFMRTLGLRQAAEADWAVLDPETQALLEAYTAGINAYLDQQAPHWPLEFKILGFEPEPWTPVDSLMFGKLVAWGLSNNYHDELRLVQLADVLPWDDLLTLLPDYPGPFVIPDAQRTAHAAAQAARLLQMAESASAVHPWALPDQGSNAWVVGGSHTASGQPMLAGDPHQKLTMPTLWYEVGLHTADDVYHVVGASLPGLPGVEIGHNAFIAWAVTNARPDVQDLFVETLNAEGTAYRFQGEWRPLTVREEVIQVKGAEPVVLRVRSTHHGPLVSDALGEQAPEGESWALRWTGIDQGRPLARAVLRLNRARNWDEFRAALADWQVPGLHFVYADVEGNIGYQMSGAVPIRAKNDVFGLVPVPGDTGEYEWVGFIPYEDLPHALNPAADFFASANNRPVGPDYPYFLSHYFQPPYRAEAIAQALRQAQGLTLDDFAALQGSWYSALNHQVAQVVAHEVTPRTPAQEAAVRYLAAWDGVMAPDSPAAHLSEVLLWQILVQVLQPRLPEEPLRAYLSLAAYPYMFLQGLLDDPQHPWWQGERRAKLQAALEAALAEAGEDPQQWGWGRVHTYEFAHPLGQVGLLRPIFNRGPYATGGNWNTLNSGAYLEPYRMELGPAYRFLVDLADWDSARSIIPSGQSGQPFSPHYDDQIEPWLKVEYRPLPFSTTVIEGASQHVLRLLPAGAP